jgi:hypothetical protein
MTDISKFEQMLEHLFNEEQDKAKELFHQLVVEKSREIYEGILSEDFGSDDESESSEDDIGGDATDDFIDDVEASDDDDSESFGDAEDADEDEDLEDRVVDLEDALDELRAEFEALMSQEEGEEEHSDFDFDSEGEESEEDSEDSDFDFGDEDEEETKENFMREYVEKVTLPKGGDSGANTKSIVAKPNKMGGSAANIARGDEESTGGTKGGLLNPSTKEEDFGNINVPGGNAGKTAFKKKESGHGAEKKGSSEDAQNKKSIIGGKK